MDNHAKANLVKGARATNRATDRILVEGTVEVRSFAEPTEIEVTNY